MVSEGSGIKLCGTIAGLSFVCSTRLITMGSRDALVFSKRQYRYLVGLYAQNIHRAWEVGFRGAIIERNLNR